MQITRGTRNRSLLFVSLSCLSLYRYSSAFSQLKYEKTRFVRFPSTDSDLTRRSRVVTDVEKKGSFLLLVIKPLTEFLARLNPP